MPERYPYVLVAFVSVMLGFVFTFSACATTAPMVKKEEVKQVTPPKVQPVEISGNEKPKTVFTVDPVTLEIVYKKGVTVSDLKHGIETLVKNWADASKQVHACQSELQVLKK